MQNIFSGVYMYKMYTMDCLYMSLFTKIKSKQCIPELFIKYFIYSK